MNPVQIITPGTETAEQYHRSGAWGSTLISQFLRSPRLANAIRTGAYQPPETASKRLGSRFHTLMDPTGDFAKRYRCGPDVDRRTTAWRTAEAEAKAAGHELISTDDWSSLHAMQDSVHSNPVAHFLSEGAEHEVGLRMTAPQGDFQVQCRADVLRRWNHLGDYKTTDNIDAFAQSVISYGYHRQAALYRWITWCACGAWLPFSFIAVEKEPPYYRCRVFDLTEEYLALGWQEVEAALVEIGKRTASNDWADHRDAESLSPPHWFVDRVMSEAA